MVGVSITVNNVPDPELTAMARIEVRETCGEPIRYQLNFAVDIEAGDLPLLTDSRFAAETILGVFVVTPDGTRCLVNGPVHAHNVNVKHGGSGSSLVVSGADKTILLAREDKAVQWQDTTDSAVVRSILGSSGFSENSFQPEAGSESGSRYSPNKHTLLQRSDDLSFIRKLARRNGYLFWLDYDDDAKEKFYFKKPSLENVSPYEVVINLDDANVDECHFSWDTQRPDSVNAAQLDLNVLSAIDGAATESGLVPLGSNTLAAIRGAPFTTHLAAVVDDAAALRGRAQGLLSESGWFVTGVCATSMHRLKGVIRAHQVVNLRGAGSRYSGHYLVSSAKHFIDASAHLMEFTLVRNAW